MACAKSLFKSLGSNTSTGGDWTILTNITGLNYGDGADENTPPVSYTTANFTAGDTVGSTEYLWVTFTGVAAGSYTFRYTVTSGGKTATSDITVNVKAVPNAGTAVTSVVWCKDSTTRYTLFTNLLQGADTTGVWSGQGTTLPGYDTKGTTTAVDDTFTPAGNGFTKGDSVQFIYTVQSSDVINCTDCVDQTVVNVLIDDYCSCEGDCGGQYVLADYYLDIFDAGVVDTPTFKITSFVYDGDTFVDGTSHPSGLSISGGNTTFQDTSEVCYFTDPTPSPYVASEVRIDDVANVINALNAPGFIVTPKCLFTSPLCTSNGSSYSQVAKYYNLEFPACKNWEIVFQFKGVNWMKWDQDAVYKWLPTPGSWQDITDGTCTAQAATADCPGIYGCGIVGGIENKGLIDLCP